MKLMKFIVVLFIMALIVSGCASKQKVPKEQSYGNVKKDYEVIDHARTSGDLRPGWIDNPSLWVNEHKDSFDNSKYVYFAYETDQYASQKYSCELAKARAREHIAAEIATFIDKSLAESDEGSAAIDENNPRTEPLRNFISSTLAEKVQALIHGSRVIKVHWEKRKYLKNLGAKRDYTAYVCAALIQMETERLKNSIDEAADFVAKKADDPETKENVKKALENVEEKFVKAKHGDI